MSAPGGLQPLAPSAPAYVRAGERVSWAGKPTLAVLVKQVFGLAALALFVSFAVLGNASRFGQFSLVAAPAFVALLVLVLILNAVRLRRTEYVLTDHGVYTRTGVIGQTITQTTFDKITDISLKQDVLGRLLGYSDLHVNTAGSNMAPVRMEGLHDALGVKNLVEQARDTFLRAGPGPTPAVMTPPSAVPRFVPERLLMTIVCPTTQQPFRRPRSEAGKAVPCPHCKERHLAEVRKPGRARSS